MINNRPVYTSYTDKRKIKKHINRKLKYINKKKLSMSLFCYKIILTDNLEGYAVYIKPKINSVFYTKRILSNIIKNMFIGKIK